MLATFTICFILFWSSVGWQLYKMSINTLQIYLIWCVMKWNLWLDFCCLSESLLNWLLVSDNTQILITPDFPLKDLLPHFHWEKKRMELQLNKNINLSHVITLSLHEVLCTPCACMWVYCTFSQNIAQKWSKHWVLVTNSHL